MMHNRSEVVCELFHVYTSMHDVECDALVHFVPSLPDLFNIARGPGDEANIYPYGGSHLVLPIVLLVVVCSSSGLSKVEQYVSKH